jgi:hypothetical protein
VFYIAGEGHNGLARRFKAWELGNGVSLQGAPLYKSHRAAQLYDATEAAMVAEAIKTLATECGYIPAMIVIDTLARNMGGDENSTQDMNSFIQHLDTYLRQDYKCCVLVAHHSGAADKERSRGSTALKGALDAEYKCQLDSGSKTIQFESKKMKDAEMPAIKNFQITQVDLPILDKHGNPVKGAYLTSVDISGLVSSVQKRTVLPGNQLIALNCLVAIEAKKTTDGMEGIDVSANYDEWRESAKSHGLNPRRFKESVEGLTKKDMVSLRNEVYRSMPKTSKDEAK